MDTLIKVIFEVNKGEFAYIKKENIDSVGISEGGECFAGVMMKGEWYRLEITERSYERILGEFNVVD